MYHTTLQATPGQLLFVRENILNTYFIAKWESISVLKQQLTEKKIVNHTVIKYMKKY